MPAATRSSLSTAIGTPAMSRMICRGWIEFTPEIQAVWDRFRADRNTADFQRLIEHYSPMVLHVAMREKKRLPHFYRSGVDEIVSDGLTALMRWFMRAPAEMSVATIVFWARKTVRLQIRRAAFETEQHRKMLSLDAKNTDEALPLHQTIAIDTPAPFTPILDSEFTRLVMRGLNPREKQIIRKMLLGYSGVEIGNALGVSRQRAKQLMDRLLANLSQREDLVRYRDIDRGGRIQTWNFAGCRRDGAPFAWGERSGLASGYASSA